VVPITRFDDSIPDGFVDDVETFFLGERTLRGFVELKLRLPVIIAGLSYPIGVTSPEDTILIALFEDPELLFWRERLFKPYSRNLVP